MKLTSVPDPKHVAVQAWLTTILQETCPKGWEVDVFTEKPYENYKIDVYARYFHRAKRKEKLVFYECQTDLNNEDFTNKTKTLIKVYRIDVRIIDLNKVPNDIREAHEYLKGLVIGI
jgi:hypothetical protein